MVVSEVEITPVKPRDGLVGFASCVLYGELYVRSIAVHKTLRGAGFRLVYPAKRIGSRDINYFHPLTRELAEQIEQAIADKCKAVFGEDGEQEW